MMILRKGKGCSMMNSFPQWQGWGAVVWDSVVHGRMVVEETSNCLRCGKGSGMRIASGWQLGVFVECRTLIGGRVAGLSQTT